MNRSLILGIDASNIRLGGGITHLHELLLNFESRRSRFKRVVIWGCDDTLAQLPNAPWLEKVHPFLLNKNLLFRTVWQIFIMRFSLVRMKCDVLMVPGGLFFGSKVPAVVMCQNLLPFEAAEIRRYGFFMRRLKFLVLNRLQISSFKRASGLIFLSSYSKNLVMKLLGRGNITSEVIAHGMNPKFLFNRESQPFNQFLGITDPLKIIYVSNIDFYKHQESVLSAIKLLRDRGRNIDITFVGPSFAPALKRLRVALSLLDSRGEWSRYLGSVPYENLPDYYRRSDMAIFASSCETFGIILLEKMASGLAIACSDRSTMPEILQDGGRYFDPEVPVSIANAIEGYITSPNTRIINGRRGFDLSQQYSWKSCAQHTFSFLEKIALNKKI